MTGPDLSHEGRVTLIAGSGRGFGLVLADALAPAGCALAIQDVDARVAHANIARLRAAGHRAIGLGGMTNAVLSADLINQTIRPAMSLFLSQAWCA